MGESASDDGIYVMRNVNIVSIAALSMFFFEFWYPCMRHVNIANIAVLSMGFFSFGIHDVMSMRILLTLLHYPWIFSSFGSHVR